MYEVHRGAMKDKCNVLQGRIQAHTSSTLE